jgi:hypothetical protein
MKRKISWRTLKFIPVGGDESQAITFKSKGFMHVCEQFRYGDKFSDYTIWDTKGMFTKHGNNNVDIDWSDFRKALIKFQLQSPPEKPSVFHGEWFPPQHTIDMRKRLLAAVCREYISPQSLAEDLLVWLAKGREEDTRVFLLTLLHGVGWQKPTSDDPESAAADALDARL